MIKNIKIINIPPYNGGEQTIEAKHINFLFGLNGSGKTTISRYLLSPNDPRYCNCAIEWEDNNPIRIVVYNRDYVNENFRESSIPGIFTLGEENIDIQKQITAHDDSIKQINEDLLDLQKKLDDFNTQLDDLNSTYTDKFWTVKQQFDKENSQLQAAIEGFRGSKKEFKQKLLNEYSSNKEKLKERSELEQLCAQLYRSKGEKYLPLTIPVFDQLLALENKEILKKVVVGKDDVDISKLIKKLGNDAWFKQGVSYVKSSDNLCPFCQRPLEDGFMDKIEEYFDESYRTAIEEIDRINTVYCQISEKISSEIQIIIDHFSEFDKSIFVKSEELKTTYQKFNSIVNVNKKYLIQKKDAPNTVVQLDSIEDSASSIISLLKESNEYIIQYNIRIDNIKDEKKSLTDQVWRYILNSLSEEIKIFLKREKELNNSIKFIETEIQSLMKERDSKSEQQRLLEQRLTSVLPTAKGINDLLKNYGVTGFSLKVDEAKKTYQIVRDNDTPAFDSLSEGERSFMTFLYFLYSLQGNTEDSGHNYDKIVVIDDPVSSLDSDMLFIISSMLRDLFKNIYAEEGTIKQLFILSHNSLFYKEVSYNKGLTKNKTGYWMITKANDISNIVKYSENPVSSTYEMLWDEVRKAKEKPTSSNTISLANIMRRIIEHYFGLLGGIDLNRFHLEFPDGERQIFKSLISWANAGSHSAFDDYSATPNLYNSEKYLKVFRDLFDKAGHLSHYNMMMRIAQEEN